MDSSMLLEADPAKRPLVLSEPAPNQREWAIKVLQRGYEASGHTNAIWDKTAKAVFLAFADYTRISDTNWPALRAAIATLSTSGCDDSMVQYILARYPAEAEAKEVTAAKLIRAHDAILKSRHHPLFKFMAGLRAVQSARSADKQSERSSRISWVTANLVDTTRDTNAPVEEVFQAVDLWLRHSHGKGWGEYVLNHVGPFLKQNWEQTDLWPVMQGRMEIEQAWSNRGGGYAHKVSADGWQGFEAHLAKAEEYLTLAWEKKTSKAEIAYLMMRVELGQGRGRPRMEQWFNRAMTLETNFYDAAKLMSFYLEPRWYGSDEVALKFARSCVTTDRWGGAVPLVLADLHRSLAKYHYPSNAVVYWKQPEVWPDVRNSYEKFFQLNPEAVSYHHNYAMDAYRCGQHGVFLKQTGFFLGGTNYAFFGGQSEFEAMVKESRERVGQ